jgi:acyl-CoA synthetase (NDP forming)
MSAGGGIPTYVYPEDATRTLGRAMKHVRWRARPAERPPGFLDARRDEAAATIAAALGEAGEWLGMEAAAELLDCYGIATPPWRRSSSCCCGSARWSTPTARSPSSTSTR